MTLWEAISVGLRRGNQMKVFRKLFRMMIRQFIFHCDGLRGADSAEMDCTIVYFVLKWPENRKPSFTLTILHPFIQKKTERRVNIVINFLLLYECNIRSSHISVLIFFTRKKKM